MAAKDRQERFAGAARVVSLGQVIAYVRACLRIVGPDRKLVAAAVALAMLSGLLQIALMYLMAALVLALSDSDGLSRLAGWTPSWTVEATLFAALAILASVLLVTFPLARVQALTTSRVVARTRRSLAEAYVETRAVYRAKLPEGYLQQLIGEYSQNLSMALQHFCGFVTAIASLGVLVAVPLVFQPRAGAIVIALVVAGLLVIGPLTHFLRRDAVKRAAVTREIATLSAQLARLADEMEEFDVGKRATELLDRHITSAERLVRRIQFHETLVPVLYQLGVLALLLTAIAVALLVRPADHSEIAVVALLAFRVLTYGRQMLLSLQQGSALLPIAELIDRELHAIAANRRPRGGIEAVGFDGLAVTGLSFAHAGAEPILRGSTLRIEAGEAVAITGPSGQGKSTLCALLLGVREPTSGTIATGGVPIAAIAPARWARLAAHVPQNPKLMRGTIAENILFFREGFSREDLERAARQAHLHDEILTLPRGYDTVVGPGARGLSGGQQQRLVIARALLGAPSLLVLDEPSSALDARSEALIVQTLAEIKGKVTIVCVTHRAAALAVCDRILRLNGGGLNIEERAGAA